MDRRIRFMLIELLLRQGRMPEAMDEIESALADFGPERGMVAAAVKVRETIGPKQVAPSTGGRPGLTLCMITRNEESCLARCLNSVKSIVDEIVVVDTGSSDETKGIATAFGAQVVDVRWHDDFSEARNAALERATGGWILVLDADEAISAGDRERLGGLMERASENLSAYRLCTRNYTRKHSVVGFTSNRGEYPEEQGAGWYPSEKVRLFPNDPRIRFAYPVHELVEPSLHRIGIPILDCPVVVHHYGTLDDRAVAAKTATYRSLGGKKRTDAPARAASLRERAVQAAQMGRFGEALTLWKQFVRMHPESTEAYVNMGSCCWSLGRYDEAAGWAEHALKMNPSLKEARFNLAYAELLKGKGVQALAILERLVLDEPDYPAARFLLCVARLCAGDGPGGEAAWMALQASPLGPYLGEAFREVETKLLDAGCSDAARRLTAALKGFSGSPPATRMPEQAHTA